MVTNHILCNRPQSSTPEGSELGDVLATECVTDWIFFSYFPLWGFVLLLLLTGLCIVL